MVYFTDVFDVDEEILEAYGSFNISLINDLPLFIDPFLLFGNEKTEYQKLHQDILKYLSFLKEKAEQYSISDAQIKAWYKFPEVKQNWMGYSRAGNSGSGLGLGFGRSMSDNITIVFRDLHHERVTVTSHLEKAALFEIGVGKDNISDFTCNLIKYYLLGYTQEFAQLHLKDSQKGRFSVAKVYFDYALERWMPKHYILPIHRGDYVLLTPKDLLTKDDTWISAHDLRGGFESICSSVPNDQLRAEIQNYFHSKIPPSEDKKKPSAKEISFAVSETIKKYPDILDYYIKVKEENKGGAKSVSEAKIEEVEKIFIENVTSLIQTLQIDSGFYKIGSQSSFLEALKRVNYLKDVIENKDGYRLFYVDGKPIKREADLQIIYRLTWHATDLDVNREVNNGRGPVDYAVSKGSADKTLVEFKLASNSKLKSNLEHQVAVYQKANDTNKSIKVIMYFEASEFVKVKAVLKELKLEDADNIILIDARNDNKPSASNVK